MGHEADAGLPVPAIAYFTVQDMPICTVRSVSTDCPVTRNRLMSEDTTRGNSLVDHPLSTLWKDITSLSNLDIS